MDDNFFKKLNRDFIDLKEILDDHEKLKEYFTLDSSFYLEVLKVGILYRPDIEKMTSRSIGNYHTVTNGKRAFVLTGPPAIQCFAVKKTLPAICILPGRNSEV